MCVLAILCMKVRDYVCPVCGRMSHFVVNIAIVERLFVAPTAPTAISTYVPLTSGAKDRLTVEI